MSLLFPKRREAHVAEDGSGDDRADVHGVHARAKGNAQEDVQKEHQEHDGSDDHTADRHGFAHLLVTFSGTANAGPVVRGTPRGTTNFLV
jgi:hypothetical protein